MTQLKLDTLGDRIKARKAAGYAIDENRRSVPRRAQRYTGNVPAASG